MRLTTSGRLAASLLLIAMPQLTAASPPRQFSDAAFSGAREQNQTIVLETYASWCAPCQIQAPILERLSRREPFSEILILRIGEETPPSVWRRFSLNGYGRLVVFKDGREVARGTPTTARAVTELLSRGF
ncbi:thioredoxin family protein [Parasphingopyxis algicola]|uniref:thioredoxin family protein n=1 Tax=Parasphingopyxis algicola TaxID=2026624 RepID=UPI0015A0DA54|nr:thioredoxin family protein [Parasphingopyxis algicola]